MAFRVAAMQPYLFPYFGYFQLIRVCDAFVFLDDVQYIRRGWINRNVLRISGRPMQFTLPVTKSALDSRILDVQIDTQRYGRFRSKFLASIRQSYGRAEHFDTVYPLIESVLVTDALGLASLVRASVEGICGYLGIETRFYAASDTAGDRGGSRSEQIVALVKAIDGREYVNPAAGVALYDRATFRNAGIRFLALAARLRGGFRDSTNGSPLSVIDTLMRFDRDRLRAALLEAEVTEP